MSDVASRRKYIAIAGVDGSGKTTITDWLRQELSARGHEPGFVWSRFNNYSSLPFLALTRMSGHNRYAMVNGKRVGFHDFEDMPQMLRYMFVATQTIDVNIANLLRIKAASRGRDVVICERGPWDSLVDVAADTGLHHLITTRLRRYFCWQLERDTEMLLIDRNEQLILAARPELSHDTKIVDRIAMYRQLASHDGWTVIDNDGPIEQTFATISRWLDERGY